MSKSETDFYYHKHVGKGSEIRRIDADKHPLLAMFIASNVTQIFKDHQEYSKYKNNPDKLVVFPTYFSKKPIFDMMCEQLGVKNQNEVLVSYEVPAQTLFLLKPKTEKDENSKQRSSEPILQGSGVGKTVHSNNNSKKQVGEGSV